MSAPAAAPPAVYSLCSGVHDAHDETIKKTTVAAAPIQLFHLITATPPWVSSNSRIKHCEFCHFLDAESIEEANFSHSPGFVMMGIRYIGYIKKRPQPPTGLRPLADVSVSARLIDWAPVRRGGSARGPHPCRWWLRSRSCRTRAESTGSTGFRLSRGNPPRRLNVDQTASSCIPRRRSRRSSH